MSLYADLTPRQLVEELEKRDSDQSVEGQMRQDQYTEMSELRAEVDKIYVDLQRVDDFWKGKEDRLREVNKHKAANLYKDCRAELVTAMKIAQEA